MGDDGAFRRTLTVLLVYAAGAWVVLLLGQWLRSVLILPMIFDDLLRWGVYLGAGVAALMAWFYPSLAGGSSASRRSTDSR